MVPVLWSRTQRGFEIAASDERSSVDRDGADQWDGKIVAPFSSWLGTSCHQAKPTAPRTGEQVEVRP